MQSLMLHWSGRSRVRNNSQCQRPGDHQHPLLNNIDLVVEELIKRSAYCINWLRWHK